MGQGYHSKIDGLPQANYMQVVPNSHFWTDLNQIITSFDVTPVPTKEYLLIGLNNTIKNGYKLKQLFKSDKEISFESIEEMIDWIKSEYYDEKEFYVALNVTMMSGYNLTNGLKLQRTDIYKRINQERDYQDQRWHGCVPDEEKAIAEWINYIEFHLEKAKERVYHLSPDEALAELRKVAALAVRAMEIHGCPERNTKIPTKKWNVIPNDGTTEGNLTLKTFTNNIEDK